MAKINEKDSQAYRKKMSLVGKSQEKQEFSEALSTDLRKLNENKFFFNLE